MHGMQPVITRTYTARSGVVTFYTARGEGQNAAPELKNKYVETQPGM